MESGPSSSGGDGGEADELTAGKHANSGIDAEASKEAQISKIEADYNTNDDDDEDDESKSEHECLSNEANKGKIP